LKTTGVCGAASGTALAVALAAAEGAAELTLDNGAAVAITGS